MAMLLTVVSGLALLSSSVVAHPGHDLTQEIAERREFLNSVKRTDLSHCADKLKARGVTKRNVARRSAMLEKARAKRGLKKRDLDTVLATSHNATSLGYTLNTDAATLFSGNNSCILTPEVTQGPYYVGGEYVRRNLIEDQEGLDTILDYQVIDVNTCEPVTDVYLEMWHCNSTGVYSGVVASGNGDSSDETNINNTFLRGIQKTDSDGVAQFESLFPGHYTSRATHIHIMVHTNATLYQNSTLGNEVTSSHVGQAFFDQDLITAVEALAPYNTNTQELTTNADDGILSEETATDGVDPFFEYTLLGDSIEDGLFAWISFGINATQSSSVTPAAFLYAEGGVTNDNAGSIGGGAPPSGSGVPSGSPSGSAPPTLSTAA
ncbi:aromatic compound dioxygenase [Camillea tinctor]|nr:aromatic compound dioxygenase [Camillea tinctor]